MANAGFDPGIANEVLDFGSGIFEFVRRVVRIVILCAAWTPAFSLFVVI
jgi:hypothetical protein